MKTKSQTIYLPTTTVYCGTMCQKKWREQTMYDTMFETIEAMLKQLRPEPEQSEEQPTECRGA